tara:strand:+ start:9853 stop:10134 length:282 start_codon:yes stop_codon:yes gene_type:complete
MKTLIETTVDAIKDWKATRIELGNGYTFFEHLINIKTGHDVGEYMLLDVFACYLKRERLKKDQINYRILNKTKYGVSKYGLLTDLSLQVNENS